MKLILALGTGVGAALAMSGCGLILDQHPDDSGVSIDAGAFDAFDARDAPLDVGSDGFAPMDVGTDVFAAMDDATHNDTGFDAGSAMSIDAGRDAARDPVSDAGRDAGSDAGRDAGTDAFLSPDAFTISPSTTVTFAGPSHQVSIDVSPNGNAVTIGSAASAYYVSWEPETGWTTTPYSAAVAAVAIFDDEMGIYASPMLNMWVPPGPYAPAPSFAGSPSLLAAGNHLFASSDRVTALLFDEGFTSIPVPGPLCTPMAGPWPAGSSNTVLSIAAEASTTCGRVAAGVSNPTLGRRVFFSASATPFLATGGARTLGACVAAVVPPGGSVFGDDVALLPRGMEMTLATTAADGPRILQGPYRTLPGAPATSVALGHNGSSDILLAWTTTDQVRVQSLVQVGITTCPPVAAGDSYSIVGDKVRISDCNSGTVTVVVRTASSVQIMRVPCPAP